jgi:hypothetical protein
LAGHVFRRTDWAKTGQVVRPQTSRHCRMSSQTEISSVYWLEPTQETSP